LKRGVGGKDRWTRKSVLLEGRVGVVFGEAQGVEGHCAREFGIFVEFFCGERGGLKERNQNGTWHWERVKAGYCCREC
jgi:hypothetical protein